MKKITLNISFVVKEKDYAEIERLNAEIEKGNMQKEMINIAKQEGLDLKRVAISYTVRNIKKIG